jgi:prolyl oligopeptidase
MEKPRMVRLALLFSLLLTFTLLAEPPTTKKEKVEDTYHGTKVVEEYRWLEDAKNPAVKAWSEAQNKYAQEFLTRLPGLDKIKARLKDILGAKRVSHASLQVRGERVFALKRQPPKEQPFLVVLPGIDQPDKARVILDTMDLDKKGTTAIDWYVASPDGKIVAMSLSKVGSEAGDLHLYDTETRKEVGEVIPRVQNGTAGGDLVWAPDGKGFYYTRYPRSKEKREEDLDFYQQLYYHAIGTPTETDRYELGKDLPRIAEIRLQMHDATGRLLCSVQNGDGGEFAQFVRSPDGKWRQFASFPDKLVQATWGPTGDLYVVSRESAPRGKILKIAFDTLDTKKAAVVVPEPKDAKDSIVTDFWSKPTALPTKSRLYVLFQQGGPSTIKAFGLNGGGAESPRQMPIARVEELTPLGGDDIAFEMNSYVEPTAIYRYKAVDGLTQKLPLTSPATVKFNDIEVVRRTAVSKDGTKVPVNILKPRDVKMDGKNPCLVTGYGGYGVNLEPRFSPDWRVLFDAGFVVAVANLRGGAEFGEEWHVAGNLTRKQNVFDDFAAVCKFMTDQKYTNPQKLAIQGGSNGGLLMGATLTQHPELMKCVVSSVGIYDMLRVELSPNGAFNVPEFGTVKDADQFKAMLAYSPYHNVKDGTKYPAVLFLTGANDPRVDPMQSRKMTARLQAATASMAPILLRTSDTAGHGLDTSLSERIDQESEIYAFLFDQLGVKVD